MVESCPKDSPGQQAQTLLEAAKAMSCQCTGHPSQAQWEVAVANLRAAIAREEAKASYVSEADVSDYWSDRAQQAEASAAWHKAESERLSAELALTRNQLTLAVERSERLSGQLAGCHYDLGEARKQRQRAEKAEAECSEQRARAESGEDRNRDLSEKLIAAHGKTHAESERAKKTESELATAKADTRAKAQNELRSIERALCSADVLNKFASMPRDAYSCHVHNTIETAISALRDDAATPPYSPPFEGDPKACAFKPSEPKVGIVRDPVTGWTFDTMRQQFDAARTTVRVLAAELVAARQQIAGTNGFEAKEGG